MSVTKQVYASAIAIVLIMSALAIALQAQESHEPASAQTLTKQATAATATGIFVGDVVDPPVAVQDFILPSSADGITRFSDLDGNWRVLFFGYLRCPDLCPLTLVDFMRVKELLGNAAGEVTFVYISVDGVRDSADNMRTYLAAFDPAFVGFSGDDLTLQRIQPDYGFYYERRLGSSPQSVYTVDHSTRAYLVDRDGVLVASFAYQTPPPAFADAIRWYLAHE